MPPTGQRRDPLHRHNYTLEIEGRVLGYFMQVEGLEREYELIEYREGGDIRATRKFAGQGRAGNITLRYGLTTQGFSVVDYLRQHVDNSMAIRRSGSVILNDDRGREMIRWNFTRAFPLKWRGPELDASGKREFAIEELVLAVESIDVPEDKQSGEGRGD